VRGLGGDKLHLLRCGCNGPPGGSEVKEALLDVVALAATEPRKRHGSSYDQRACEIVAAVRPQCAYKALCRRRD